MKALPLMMSVFLISGCMEKTPSLSGLNADSDGRAALGRAAPYPADALDAAALNEDMQARRKAGWNVLMKAMELVSLPGLPELGKEVPKFLTWYGRGEFAPLARELYDTAEVVGDGFSDEAIEKVFASKIKPQKLDPELFSPDPAAAAGIGLHRGAAATLFTESMLKHYLKFANSIADCSGFDDFEPTSTSFSPCMEEFSPDAVMVKAVWHPVLDGRVTTRVFDTGADHFKELFSDPNSFAPIRGRPLEIGVDQAGMYQIQDRSGQRWALAAIHIVTKEVREWVWSTFWWSDTPDQDFGADRPARVTGVWKNYKMCVQTNFYEGDDEIGSGLPDSLAGALEASTGPRMHTQAGRVAGWCANPYIEGGFPQSTCIGCHQAAGGGSGMGRDPSPDGVFPGDFSFAFSSFQRMLKNARGDDGQPANRGPTPIRGNAGTGFND